MSNHIRFDNVQANNLVIGDGNVIIDNVMFHSESNNSIQTSDLNPDLTNRLLDALDKIRLAAPSIPTADQTQANIHIEKIDEELHKDKPSQGKLQAAYDALRRLCKNEIFYKYFSEAVKLFGTILPCVIK